MILEVEKSKSVCSVLLHDIRKYRSIKALKYNEVKNVF